MSGPGPDNPFGGLPFFGDLARMLGGQGPVNWEAARQFAVGIATGGASEPNVDPSVRMRFEELARVAELQVAELSGLTPAQTGRALTILPVTRAVWAQRTIAAWQPLFEQLAGALSRPPEGGGDEPDPADPTAGLLGGLLQLLSPVMLGMAVGSLSGHLARRSLGQYELPVPRPPSDEILVVPANVDAFGEAWALPPDDLRLHVCLEQVAVHAVLGVPHVRAALTELLGAWVSGFRPDPRALEDRLGELDLADPSSLAGLQDVLGDPATLLGAIQSPAQEALRPRIDALVAVIVGWVDHLMDRVGPRFLGSYGQLVEALRRRRVEADRSDALVERLLGLSLTQADYDRGSAFVDGVVERAGEAGLDRLWRSPDTLPTAAEVDAPGLWLARLEFLQDEPPAT